MSNKGIGVLINMLGGNEEDVAAFKKAIGKKIKDIVLVGDVLTLTMDDGYKIKIWDGGQSCCEHRYMSTDDMGIDYVGATLLDAEIRTADNIPYEDGYGEEHEVQFFVLLTDRGNITFQNHNEHNGYYGGFWVKVAEA